MLYFAVRCVALILNAQDRLAKIEMPSQCNQIKKGTGGQPESLPCRYPYSLDSALRGSCSSVT